MMHLQIFLPIPDVPLGQIKHTNRCIEVLYCLDIYVEAIIMTLGYLREPPSNPAMFRVLSVMIPDAILESISWCY